MSHAKNLERHNSNQCAGAQARQLKLDSGEEITATLRRAYRTEQLIGLTLRYRSGGAITQIEKFDINPGLLPHDREMAEATLSNAFAALGTADDFVRIQRQLSAVGSAALFSHCVLAKV